MDLNNLNLDEYVTKATGALQADAGLMKLFTGEPVKAIEKILGVDLPDGVIEQIIKLVQKQLAGGAKDEKEGAGSLLGGALDALKKIF